MKYKWLIFAIVVTLNAALLMMGNLRPAQASTPLPEADWYAITWVPASDTLHWINENGEQGSLPRPQLPDETPEAEHGIHIAPDGRYMVMVSPLETNRLGIGFYDFQTAQWIQTHQAQVGEVIPNHSRVAFSFTGDHVALTLRHEEFGVWRVLVFETATGDVVDQLTPESQILPDNFITALSWWPVVSGFGLDDGAGQRFVNLQQVTNDPLRLSYPSFMWYHNPVPALADAPVVPDDLPYSPIAGFDILPATQAVAFTGFDTSQTVPQSNTLGNFIGVYPHNGQLPVTIIPGAGYTLSEARWLRAGEWLGYRTENDQQPPYYAVSLATEDTSLPLGPNIGALHNTPDGFIAVDALAWQLYHATSLDFEAFAPQVGNTIFMPGTAFQVVYTTPIGATFGLAELPTQIVGNGDTIQAPPSAPSPTPLSVQPVVPTATPLQVQTVQPLGPTATPLNVAPPIIQPTATPLQVQPVQPVGPSPTPLQIQVVPINPTATPALGR